ncbi:MAG TPA: peptidylprolyl isomerase [Candidatus Eremiobacteraceae bacterium]|nr:peptidylprolyl isomerase [Candidatus Eremiobacteraceae bacterium]
MKHSPVRVFAWRSALLLALAAVVMAVSMRTLAGAVPTPQPNPVSSAPSESGSEMPTPAVRFSTPTPMPTYSPPAPSIPDTTAFGKIGELERAGAGPLPASDHHPHRTTQPSALLSYLSDPDPTVVARAAIALGRLRNPAGAGALIALLQNKSSSDDVKAAAAFSLGVIGSEGAESALSASVLHDDSEVAGAAADSLGRIGGDAVVDPLVRALSSRDPFVRGKAAIGLGEATAVVMPPRPMDPSFRVSAAQALSSAIRYERDPEAKWRMAWAIGRSLYDEDQADLRTMIADKEELVREFAAQGMRRLNDPKYALALHLAANDPSWRVRVEVARALASLKDQTPVNLTPAPVPDADQDKPTPMPTSSPYGVHPEVAIVTTKGTIVVELFPDEAPYTVDNFLYLVDRGYYDNQQLFRVILDFVIQGGDPTNGGEDGGPGYSIPAELNPVEQLTGVLAFGLDYPNNVPDVDSAGSQFYVTESPQLHLDENFSTFGRVVKGMAVVDAIRAHSADTLDQRKLPADIVTQMYRCQPVIAQTDDIERLLRTAEIGYDAQ